MPDEELVNDGEPEIDPADLKQLDERDDLPPNDPVEEEG